MEMNIFMLACQEWSWSHDVRWAGFLVAGDDADYFHLRFVLYCRRLRGGFYDRQTLHASAASLATFQAYRL